MTEQSATPSTSLPSAAKALALGALSGGVLLSAYYTSAARLGLRGNAEDGGPLPFLMLAIFATIAYAIGLLAAAPFWLLLHRLGFRTWIAASLLGAVLSAAASLSFVAMGGLTMQPQPISVIVGLAPDVAVWAIISAAVGWLVWASAYLSPTHTRRLSLGAMSVNARILLGLAAVAGVALVWAAFFAEAHRPDVWGP